MELTSLPSELVAVVGAAHVITDPVLKQSYEHDLTGRFSGEALLVVSPADAAEVADVLRACQKAGVPVVPQGGHTGLVGGGTPRDGEVVLNLRRLRSIECPDLASAQVTVGAGVTLDDLQSELRPYGLQFPNDHAARGSATIGGMTATNAGGSLAMRHGTMRTLVAGLEIVLSDGRTVTRLQGLIKDNAGFDLDSVFVGSEGTLGVITRVRLKLVRIARNHSTAILGLDSFDAAIEILGELRSRTEIQAVDFFEENGLQHVCAHLKIAPPLDRPRTLYLVVETASDDDPISWFASVVEAVEDGVAVTDEAGRRNLWRYRDAHNETVRALGVPLKLDVAVPISALPRFRDALEALVTATLPEAELIVYGHLGDGNLHINIVGDHQERVEEPVLRLVAEYGGSISAEHGVGIAKAPWLSLTRSELELGLMRDLKRQLDPAGMLSPGRVLAFS